MASLGAEPVGTLLRITVARVFRVTKAERSSVRGTPLGDASDYIERFYNTIAGTRPTATSARLSSEGRLD